MDAVTHSGIRALSEIASALVAGVDAEETLGVIAGALRRGFSLSRCRVWVRTRAGDAYHAIVSPGDHPATAGEVEDASRWIGSDAPVPAHIGAGSLLRLPLRFEGLRLGALEAVLPQEPRVAEEARQTLTIVANVLSPLIASTELSQDLASEVALRTREIESQRRFTGKIIDTLPVGLYVIDRQYRIQAWNRKRETGQQGVVRDEVLGRTVFDVLYRQPRDLLSTEFERVFRTGRMEQVEVESSATGETRYYRITKIPMRLDDDAITHVITIGEDVTEWKDVQHQISQTEKLAAVGQLAAGVMHEINNPLATIGACVEALESRRQDLPAGSRQAFEEYFKIMGAELERCKSIVGGLLDFSRPKARFKKAVPLNQVAEDSLFLVKHHDRFKGIQLVRQFAVGLPEIEGNAEQLIQAFLAIMINAIDAMEGKGVLTVVTLCNPDRADEVVIEFSDSGMGITRDDLPKIFEPFYTTKEPGRGTGLGLSICYGIIAEHKGRIMVDSQVGRGSTFRVFLPVSGSAGA